MMVKKIKKKIKKVKKKTKKNVSKKAKIKKIKKKTSKKVKKKVVKKSREKLNIKCAYCGKKIMYKDASVSYYDPVTKEKKIYHFKCQFYAI